MSDDKKREDLAEGTLMSHLLELRDRLMKAMLALLITFIPCAVFANDLFTMIAKPLLAKLPEGTTLIATSVVSPFMTPFKVAFFVGLFLAMPVVIYQIWAFVAPGLYAREKKCSYIFVGAAVPLFALGVFLAIQVMDRGLHFLLGMVPHGAAAFLTIDTYLGYYIAMILGFGLCFELPLVLVLLNQVGILPHARFRKIRRLLIFLVFVFAGIASPSPDPITMLLLGGVCVLLVEAAEALVYLNDRRRARIAPYEGLTDEEFEELRRTDLPVDD